MTESRAERAIALFDELNARDPVTLDVGGVAVPRELARADQLTQWVLRLEPEPSEALRLASRCQHLMRWTIARSEFPEGRAGYHAWRRHAARTHADRADAVLVELGYDPETRTELRRIVEKQGIARHRDVATMEDALCLAFLEHDLEAFAHERDDAHVIDVLRQTWNKMTPRGHALAAELLPLLPDRSRRLVALALGG